MPENRQEDLNTQAVPFFARFLEGQNCEDLTDEESEAVSGGKIGHTRKYPSDCEDGNGVTGKRRDQDIVVTMKYPSDHEEEGEVVTLKFPSDDDDQPVG